MKFIFTIILALPILFISTFASAASCAEIANNVAVEKGGEIVAVKADDADCKIKIRIPGKNGNPPRVETITLTK